MKPSPILGLLGGIGSGKSTVAALLARAGALVLDADRYAKDLLRDPLVLEEIRQSLGGGVFREGGEIDKAELANRIFSDGGARVRIQEIIHPRVRARFRKEITAARERQPESIIVLDIPLLLGSELQSLCDKLIMVRASFERRLERVRRARGWDRGELLRREACQPALGEKEGAADLFIDNEGSLDDLEAAVNTIMKKLKA